eukprot:184057-Heterocapsa_arctica.AAC.1
MWWPSALPHAAIEPSEEGLEIHQEWNYDWVFASHAIAMVGAYVALTSVMHMKQAWRWAGAPSGPCTSPA